jgi:(p)ppGpp synthase/HD superfamily hydrolase
VTGTGRLLDVVAGLPKAQAALEYAERQHAGQRRSTDGAAFIEHPSEVGLLLYRAGAPDHVIAAGVLHDVLEKTDASVDDLTARFGHRIAELVHAVSEDEQIAAYERRKATLREQVAAAGPEAQIIFAADKVSKIRELRAAIATAARRRELVNQSLFPPRRLAHFRHCLEVLEQRLGGAPLVEQLRLEVTGLNNDLKTHTEVNAVS